MGRNTGTARILRVALMAWVYLLIAGLFEIAWATAMKQSAGFTRLWPTLTMAGAMLASFALLAIAMRSLPLGTAYAVWTGIGGAGTFVLGVIFFGDALTLARSLGVMLILGGVVTLKLAH